MNFKLPLDWTTGKIKTDITDDIFLLLFELN